MEASLIGVNAAVTMLVSRLRTTSDGGISHRC